MSALSWDTIEVIRWIDNDSVLFDEGMGHVERSHTLYTLGIRARQMIDGYNLGDYGVDEGKVDWNHIARYLTKQYEENN